jgi:hypothetical protein
MTNAESAGGVLLFLISSRYTLAECLPICRPGIADFTVSIFWHTYLIYLQEF